MKTKLHIPTGQYAFVEVSVDGSLEDIKGTYDLVAGAFEYGAGLNQHDFAKVRNRLYETGQIEIEDHEKANREQKIILNQIKLAFRDTKRKYETQYQSTNSKLKVNN